MRLISASVQNYRIHRDQTVEFDPHRTVIGGPNECGKSTLAEAVHCALFLRAKVTGEALDRMVSQHGGNPVVAVCFEVAGRRYHLKKGFSGSKGTTTLTEEGGETWSAELGEEKLAALLRVDAPVGGRSAADRVAKQWAHLWAWQGKAGEDPSEHANMQRDALLARLKTQGGAAVMQSDVDARVASRFATLREQLFVRNDTPRAGSDWAGALQACNDAIQTESDSRMAFERLQQAAGDFELATIEIKACEERLELLAAEKGEVEIKLQQVGNLQVDEASQLAEANAAGERYNALESNDQRISECRSGIQARENALAPKRSAVRQLEEVAESKKQLAGQAVRQFEDAGEGLRKLRFRHELARAYVRLFELTAESDRLATKAARVRQSKDDLTEVERNLAAIPAVDNAKLKKLQSLDRKRSDAEVALKAMAAGLEVLEAAEPVSAGDTSFAVGQTQILTEDTEIRIGSGTRLRVRPGGGTTLAEVRTAVQDAQRELQKALDKLGAASLAEASDFCARRQQLDQRAGEINATLEGLGADNVGAEVAGCGVAKANAEAEVARLGVLATEFTPPANLEGAVSWEGSAGEQLRQAEAEERSLKTKRTAALDAQTGAEAAFNEQNANLEAEKRQIEEVKAQLNVLIQAYGEDAPRAKTLQELLNAKNAAEGRLGATREALRELQPELLATRKRNCERGFETNRSQLGEWGQKLAVARNILASDGITDPKGALAEAEAKARSAKEHLRTVERRAKAIQLLHRLFLEEQRALADLFTLPLAEKISGYLRCLFGPGAQAKVTLQENTFTGLEVVRAGHGLGSFQFDTLSGGAKEQVAAAVRLAMAEVLAEEHDKCLPLVFDDAFAYSDPQRVKTLQDMLGLAAERGLQIIILTCNPSDYTNLGAKQVSLLAARPMAQAPQSQPVVALTGEGEGAHGMELMEAPVNAGVTAEQRQAFLVALKAVGGHSGNTNLRTALGWEATHYDTVKATLVAEGLLMTGRGKGGSVSLVPVGQNP